jgi:predicted amino acid dehydrogenase
MKLKTPWTAHDIRSRLPIGGGLGFLFHATDPETVSFAFEGGPFSDEELWAHGPFIGSPIFHENRVVGCHIISPVPAQLWAGGHTGIRRFRQEGYEPSLKLAKECGLTHVGLGALIPFATQFGRYGECPPDLRLTTGHAATVANLGHMVSAIADVGGVKPSELRYAIFGAAGSIGSNVSRWFARLGWGDLRLIDLADRASQVRTLAAEITNDSSRGSVSIHSAEELSTLEPFDIAIIATNKAAPWIDAELLRKAPVWIDDSPPRAVTLEAETELHGEVLYLECFTRGPQGLSQTFPFRLPTSRDCYSCFAEVFVYWREGMRSDFVVGEPSLAQIEQMHLLLPKYGFQPGPLTSKGGCKVGQQIAESIIKRRTRRCT